MLRSQQTGEYATDEEDTGTAVDGGDKSIEVFDLPESEDILSPSELDASKLYQKFREVMLAFGKFQKKSSETNFKKMHNSIKAATESPFPLRSKAGSLYS